MQHAAHALRDIPAHPVMHVISAQRQPRGNVRGTDAVRQHDEDPRPHHEFLRRVAVGQHIGQLRAGGRWQQDAQLGGDHAPTVPTQPREVQ
jgi:hypothetical protein